ncbi:ABC transporter ATP-binding protein [Lacrimispora saccharolytica]|uniref:ABC transporter related protein n=1 Tax=Lacrimispora saccharolytica (strain ATCC 35040 / DSM 2544 / NRCC 2533 / WM1) TaxID=610130 RepID=D9R6U5_LACSW|nr:ABC transporter ATP-binding protein [Lacrimispora saccharolytica]ADL03601.1 ABC transporter related protein [[Clostridium] saccharolyticum WM1]QRV18255.1 ATP-binding cassette domain-containing protein [Lacrimispora saccharolytica]
MALIEVKNLKYRYPHRSDLALDGIDFQVEKGQFIGIAGENKAGKSTLCQAFAGLVPTMFRGAYGGGILIDGAEAAKTPIASLCQKVGLVFQNPFNQLSGAKDTVFEEIAFGLQNLGISRDEIFKRVEKNLKLLDIEEYRDRNPFDLSGGQTQRVAIASILAMEPKIIVLDEPTSQLDPQGSEEVFRVVDKLAKTGITIIMVEQKIEKLASYCHKILLLHEGKQVAFDTPERIFSRDDLEALGVKPPVYTQVCRALGVSRKEGDDKLYPVTLEQMEHLKDQFPPKLIGRTFPKGRNVEPGQEVFQIQDLGFHYQPDTPVIEHLDLCLDARPTAIIGQNGAGKTTLVKLLKGLLKPEAGSILFEGEDISRRTVAQLAGKVGYVFQNPDDQIFKNRVMEEVMVGPLNLGMSRSEAQKRASEALAMVGLMEAAEENPYDLDLSERKMVAIASVVAMDPRVLILDEPTIAQDAGGRAVLGQIVRTLREKGKFVLAILHDMDFVAEYFERVIIMAHGKVLSDGPGEEVFYEKDSLSKARLEQPHTTRLCEFLGYEGAFLTAEDIKAADR